MIGLCLHSVPEVHTKYQFCSLIFFFLNILAKVQKWHACQFDQICLLIVSPLWYTSVQCSAVQCSAVQCSAVQCSAVQCSAVQCSAVQCSAVQFSAVQRSAVQYSAVQCSAVQCSAVQCSAAVKQCSSVQ